MSKAPNHPNEPVFPIRGTVSDHQYSGISLRDYFAAAALQGLLAQNYPHGADWTAIRAYEAADAMLKARGE